MFKLRGIASKVHHTIVRTPHEHGYFEAHIHEFFLGGQFVRLKVYGETQVVHEADEVAVAGWRLGGRLYSLAFENHTTCKRGNLGIFVRSIIGLAYLGLAFSEAGKNELTATVAGLAGAYLSLSAIHIAAAARELAQYAWTSEQPRPRDGPSDA